MRSLNKKVDYSSEWDLSLFSHLKKQYKKNSFHDDKKEKQR